MIKKSFIVMQFCVLFAVVGLNAWSFYETGQLNDTLTGAMIGILTGIPLSLVEESTKV